MKRQEPLGQQLGRALHLVEQRAGGKLAQKAARILERELPHIRGLEVGVPPWPRQIMQIAS